MTSATSLNAIESQVHVWGVKKIWNLLEAVHPLLISSTLWMNTVAWDLKHVL